MTPKEGSHLGGSGRPVEKEDRDRRREQLTTEVDRAYTQKRGGKKSSLSFWEKKKSFWRGYR